MYKERLTPSHRDSLTASHHQSLTKRVCFSQTDTNNTTDASDQVSRQVYRDSRTHISTIKLS
ncbi:hypothetical protein AAMO2058_000987000 [Amorphochlora amoebiformis]